jgi:hypothetical protein
VCALHAMMDGGAIILPFALMRTKSGGGEKTALLIDGAFFLLTSSNTTFKISSSSSSLYFIFRFLVFGVRGGQVRTRAT